MEMLEIAIIKMAKMIMVVVVFIAMMIMVLMIMPGSDVPLTISYSLLIFSTK